MSAASGFLAKIARYYPQYIAFLGKAAFSAIFGKTYVSWGKQDERIGGSKTWVLPNPSGLKSVVQSREIGSSVYRTSNGARPMLLNDRCQSNMRSTLMPLGAGVKAVNTAKKRTAIMYCHCYMNTTAY